MLKFLTGYITPEEKDKTSITREDLFEQNFSLILLRRIPHNSCIEGHISKLYKQKYSFLTCNSSVGPGEACAKGLAMPH